MTWLARSADLKKGTSVQTYARHLKGVVAYVKMFLSLMIRYLRSDYKELFETILLNAAEFHDLGKLDDLNQAVLEGKEKASHLPVHHQDAGTAELIRNNNFYSALIVSAHHIGLPDFNTEANRGEYCFRDESEYNNETIYQRSEESLSELLRRHHEAYGSQKLRPEPQLDIRSEDSSSQQVFLRMAMSVLADADHTDSAHPNDALTSVSAHKNISLMPKDRLEKLDEYISQLPTDNNRAAIRQRVYNECKNSNQKASIVSCDSPVGTGKTTAIMAHLLSVSQRKNLRRIFIVLPYTSIIKQSVSVYRKALVLPGENPNDVVSELHHLADFEDDESREFSARWNAPIIVTTAVAFFETMASKTPSTLRRLHNLAGSAIFIDESHAALPPKLLATAWSWINIFASDWSCYWVMASGSLNRFWKIDQIDKTMPDIPEIISDEVRIAASTDEINRITFQGESHSVGIAELIEKVKKSPGPRLVILNTVQNAAVVADAMMKSRDINFEKVFHLSTALTPKMREETIELINNELKLNRNGDWVLVGTSCIEAGLDFDFASGFRESASLVSLLQTSGRVNRSGTRDDALVTSFVFSNENLINKNKGLADSSFVLNRFFEKGVPITQDLCTQAMREELMLNPTSESLLEKIIKAEKALDFPMVERLFKVIDSDSRLVVLDDKLVKRIENYEHVDWKEIQMNSVQILGYKINKLNIPEIFGHPGLYKWHLKSDSFLGYMTGIVENEKLFSENGGII